MVAILLLYGHLTAADYEDEVAQDPRIGALRTVNHCVENPVYAADYHDAGKRSIANALTVELSSGAVLDEVAVEYPIGHARRRGEGIPLLKAQFKSNLAHAYAQAATGSASCRWLGVAAN